MENDTPVWFAVTAVMTVLGALWTLYAWRNRGLASALRGAAVTLLFPALFLTDSLEMVTEIGTSIADWATGLVFSPVVWTGVALFGVSGGLFLLSGYLRNRELSRVRSGEASGTPAAPAGRDRRGELGAAKGRAEPAIDDDLAEIEAILKKRGIT